MPLRETINAAVAIGACNVEAPDALSGLLSWTETMARIHHDWHKHPLDIQSPRWQWDAAHALWFRDTK
jgi:hypothetical protein